MLQFLLVCTTAFVASSSDHSDPPTTQTVQSPQTLSPSSRPHRAFPSAEGFGAKAVGGRGGRVLHVTTLDDYNPKTERPIGGSLRWHIERERGRRIIVFDVGGTILLKDWLNLIGEWGSRITIAGQTAPGDGIQIGQFGLLISEGAHDIIMRHVRIRTTMTPLKLPPKPHDMLKKCVLIVNNRKQKSVVNNDIIFDHCSFEWGQDDSVGMSDIRRMTIQWSIIGEGSIYGDHMPAGVFDGDPAFGRGGEASQGAVASESTHRHDDYLSVHHCLFIHNQHRNMLLYTQGCVVEYVNNYVYNHINGTAVGQYGAITESTRLNFIGNCFQCGSSRKPKQHVRPLGLQQECRVPGKESNAPTPHCLYVHDNLDDFYRPDATHSEWGVVGWVQWPGFEGYYGYLPEGFVRGYFCTPVNEKIYRAAQPFFGAAIPVTIYAAIDLESVLAPHVGATFPRRDTVDKRLIDELQQRSGAAGIGANQQPPHWAADGSTITTGHDPLPMLKGGVPPQDTDRDGMPDHWEYSQRLNPNDPNDAKQDPDSDGYTNIEEYLNSLVGEE